MSLLSFILTPILGVLTILINMDNGVSLRNIKFIALTTFILNFFISLTIYILFDFSENLFQFVQEYHEISYFDFYLGVGGLSIYYILLTTIIILISLIPLGNVNLVSPHRFTSFSLHSSIYTTTLNPFVNSIQKYLLYMGKNWILDRIQLYLGKKVTFLLNKYPCLYKAMDYLFTNITIFKTYFYILVLKLHSRFKNKYSIIYSIILYVYSEYLGIMKGNISRNIGFILTLYVLYDFNNSNLIIFILLLLNASFKEYIKNDAWIRINYPILYRVILDISSLINTILICYFLDCIFINIIKPFILKLWNGLLKMYDPVRDCINNNSDSDKTPGKEPQEPKNPSDSEYYTNKNGKRVKRYYKKRNDEQKRRKRELAKEKYKDKAQAGGREIIQRESLVGWTAQEKEDRFYKMRRDNVLKKRDKDFKDYPILKDITPRRKNKKMTQEEINEFDKTTAELRKISTSAYWETNKDRLELKRPGRSTIRYQDEHSIWENSDYSKPLKGKKNVKFVEANLKDKHIPKEVLSEEGLDKGKAKLIEETDSLSDSEYLPESPDDSTFEDDLNKAMEESREQARRNFSNKKGESSKRSK